MLNRKAAVGGQVDSWCGSCKADRSHTIAAMDASGAISKVTCGHCNSNHRFRQAPGAKTTTTRRASTGRAAGSIAAASRNARPYERQRSYAVGELIDHPKYGRGTVTDVTAPTKIKVKFSDGDHTLLQATE